MVGVMSSLELMLLTRAFHRMPMMDLSVALARLSFGAGMGQWMEGYDFSGARDHIGP
jgi:hypothetical protein